MAKPLTHLPRPLSRLIYSSRRLRLNPAPHYASLSTSTARAAATSFERGPAPPRLPKEEQEIFERLQRQSTGAFSTPKTEQGDASSPRVVNAQMPPEAQSQTRAQASTLDIRNVTQADGAAEDRAEGADGEEMHPNLRRGAKPEFEGEVNPRTGEVGGPKVEPLRWGGGGDWSFNGRVTDF